MSATSFSVQPLPFQWYPRDPFLFCAHHLDAYPRGNQRLGPEASLQGRDLGQDFAGIDGWRMYHGARVPGFPRHPHRGFETVTIARAGFIDHSDSMGACARFGSGDVQWMTAGRGVEHSEMFPLLSSTHDNPVELFQIWLNLPAANKMVTPHFSMLWGSQVPVVQSGDAAGRATTVTMICGELGGASNACPAPHSWASDPTHHVVVATMHMQPGAVFELPQVDVSPLMRSLYFVTGASLQVDGQQVVGRHAIDFVDGAAATIVNGPVAADLLLLQGQPIGEPVAHYGPFVMNNHQEIRRAMLDYQGAGFGSWTWSSDEPVHPREQGRFAQHADGRREQPPA